MSRISIIVPVYNSEKYLNRCLDSLIGQTFEDTEIVLIDDQSTDKSLEIMYAYQKKSPHKIRIIENQKNMGAGASRNKGLDSSDSEFVGFIDSDDYIDQKMYEKLYNACKDTGLEIARANMIKVYKNWNISIIGRNGNINAEKIINPKKEVHYLSYEYPCVTNKLFRRDLISNRHFPENLKWEDYPFCIPLLYQANGIVSVPDIKYYYNLNMLGTTITDALSINPRLLDIFIGSDQIRKELLEENSSQELKEELDFLAIQNGLQRLRDILYSKMNVEEKKYLMSLVSALITKKYGSWQNNSLYQEYKKSRKLYELRMNLIERYFIDRSLEESNINQLETEIQKILKK